MQRHYNWTSAALLAALFIAFSSLAVEAVAAVAHIPNADLHEVIAEASQQSATSEPAFVTTQEAAMDAIFSQASFGGNNIDIIFEPATELVNASFLDLETSAETSSLLSMDIVSSPTINMFFVDTVDACGATVNPLIVGCGHFPGNNLVVESSFAAGSFGGELLAHEVGHNLGLGHFATSANLMWGTLNNNTDLVALQITTIRGSSLSQGALGSEFIRIQPILVVATATVPEPMTFALLLPGAFACVSARRRRKK